MNGHSRLNIGLLDRYTSEMTPRDERRFFASENGDPLHAAFDRKAAVHPGKGGRPVAPQEIPGIWSAAMAAKAEKGERAAYFHIPFCRTRCPYCGFYQNAAQSDEMTRYVDCLIRELAMVKDAPFVQSRPVHAVYLGGGTPTDLSAAGLSRLLQAVKDSLPLANDCEITVEGRIHGFSDEKIAACIEAGANRFSIGVQSFDTAVRRAMGRISTKEEVIGRLAYIRDLDQAAVVIDLIYGLPLQSMQVWEEDIRRYLELELDGIDLYQLNIFKGTPLERGLAAGSAPPPADIRTQADMFARGVEIMKAARYQPLSKSHWRRTTRERSVYNSMLNLPGGTCIPFGCGAGGWIKGHFFFLERRLDGYRRKIDAGEKPVARCLKQPEHSDLFKEIVRQMELGYCDLKEIGGRYGFPVLPEIFASLLTQWERAGLIKTMGLRLNSPWQGSSGGKTSART